jgi:uncharacterized protein
MGPRFVALLLCMLLVACKEKPLYSDAERILPLDSADVRIVSTKDTMVVRVELATTPDARALGLMERNRLSANGGMLFVYDSTQSGDAGFWMYRTRIPLDIAFMDSTGTIRVVLGMVPCETRVPEGCPSYPPKVPYRYALEMSAGFFRAHAIDTGAKLVLGDLPNLKK